MPQENHYGKPNDRCGWQFLLSEILRNTPTDTALSQNACIRGGASAVAKPYDSSTRHLRKSGDKILGKAYERLVILDIDGTLTDTVPLHQKAFLTAIESYSFPNLNRNWSEYRHHTDTAIFEEAWANAYGAIPAEDQRQGFLERLEAEFETVSRDHAIHEIAGAATFVQALADHGYAVAFATGGLRKLSRQKLSAIGIPFEEQLLATASEHLTRHDLVSHAISAAKDHYGITPELTISIGDGIWDLETAADLDLAFIGVGTGPKAQLLRDRGATTIPDYTSLTDVMAVLQACTMPKSND